MRTVALAALLVCFTNSVTARQPEPKAKTDPKTKTDQELLQGMWLIVGLETGGKAQPDKNYKGNTFTFAKDKATLKEAGYPPIDFTVTLDPTKTPRTIDLAGKNAAIRGIYKLDGDDLTLCLSAGGNRPVEFATKAGGDSEVFVLRRNRWERYAEKGAGFTVEMPGKPEERRRETAAPGGKVTTTFHVVRSDAERVSYLVAVTPLSGKLDAKQAEAVLEAARNAVLAEVDARAKATVDSDKEFKVDGKGGGYAGRELAISLDVPDSKAKGAVRARLFVAGERVYALLVAGTDDGVKAANVGRFWNSFRLVAEKKN